MAYTNPTFCQQSEYLQEHRPEELPPPPEFQASEELPPPSPSPPPPPPLPQHPGQRAVYGQTNPGFHRNDEERIKYSYSSDASKGSTALFHQENYAIRMNERRPIMHEREVRSRYEYIDDAAAAADEDDDEFIRNGGGIRSSRYGSLVEDPSKTIGPELPGVFTYRRDSRKELTRYALVPVDDQPKEEWLPARNSSVVLCQRSNSTRGRYARVPTQEVAEAPLLPERNVREQQIVTRLPEELNYSTSKNNVATQKLHEILTTPRKPRSRSEERTLSPSKRQNFAPGVQRGAITPTGSPSGRLISSPMRVPGSVTPNGRGRVNNGSPGNSGIRGPHTSTPTKDPPSARRCLPLNLENPKNNNRIGDYSCPASNCGRQRYSSRAASVYTVVESPNEPPPRYAYLDSFAESIPMVAGSPRYQVVSSSVNDEKSVESAFIARTAVVPPLSPPTSEANTTLASAMEKNDRRNAPLLLLLVGVLTCGLALYLSWTQGRRYYLDSAAGCGICCALAGACRSLRRTWTGLGLAGLSALSCAGLLLIAAKNPRAGTPLHDITAGALCGVSLLGASLALIALLSPKCNFARHRRVHSWIPRFSP